MRFRLCIALSQDFFAILWNFSEFSNRVREAWANRHFKYDLRKKNGETAWFRP
jgi:hypothetical protein